MRNIIITTLATTIIAVSFNANSQFSVRLDYELMKGCVGYFKTNKQINICACAIEKSNYKYFNDSSYRNDDEGFDRTLDENIERCKR
jgi:hypothetical protein